MYRCHPAVPLAVLMCLPVLLLFSASPTDTHTHKYLHSAPQECICTAECALLGVCWRVTDGATMVSSGDESRRALGTHPHSSLSLCGSECGSSVVYGSGSWCCGEGRGAEEQEGEAAGRDYDGG
ncbi:mucin-associated surface protein (MASP) [Trypanosoma cruzi]|nr:mucin-associated surface protein (MASP) [Trypanosoma cruzi]